MEINRRKFIRGATIVGAGVAASGAFGSTVMAAGVPEKWDQEYDVLVVGSGAAGLAAAIEAADGKASVLVLERLPEYGGASIVSGGNYGSYGTDVQKAAAEKDPEHFANDNADLYYKERLALGGWRNDPAMVRVFADRALDGYNWLVGLGIKWGTVRTYADLGPMHAPENVAGMYMHSIWNMPYTNGVWEGPFTKGRHHRNSVYKEFSGGKADIVCMADNCDKRGVKMGLQMDVVEVIREGGLTGPVLGLRVKDLAKGNTLAIRAKKGVVLAAGGFTANAELCKRHDPRLSVNTLSSATAVAGKPGRGCLGDVLHLAMDAGADAVNMHVVQLRVQGSTVAYSGPGSTVLAGEEGAYIDVDNEGKRFWMETSMTAYRNAQLEILHNKGIDKWWGIADADNFEQPEATIKQALDMKGAFKADTLAELAKTIGVPEANLVEAVNRWNQAVDKGSDEQFGQVKAFLTNKIDKAPFYAMPKTYYRHTTTGGLRCNPQSQVLDRRGVVIPNLYAAGEIVGNVHGFERDGGCGWTNCIVFGRIAGVNAAAGGVKA